MPQARSIRAMIRCGPGGRTGVLLKEGPMGETRAPAKMAPAVPMLCGGRLAAFGLSLRPPSGMGIGRAFCASRGCL